MKRSILFGKYLAVIVIAATIFGTGCKREKGMHDAVVTVNTTGLTTYDYLRSKTGVYDSLLLLVDKFAGMRQILTNDSVTLFAPSNASFQIAIQNLNDLRKSRNQDPVYLSQLAAGTAGVVGQKNIEKARRDSASLDTLVSMYILPKFWVASDFAIGDGQYVNSVRGGILCTVSVFLLTQRGIKTVVLRQLITLIPKEVYSFRNGALQRKLHQLISKLKTVWCTY